jgi:peptidoglycan/LPS O-acetylase OafA/YrhL
MYIYAFPVEQTVVWTFDGNISPVGVVALALPVTYLLALASWRFIERLALAFKRQMTERGRGGHRGRSP